MSTTTEAPAAKPARKRKVIRYIVTLDGIPCRRVCDPRFGRKLIPGRGSLVQNLKDPEIFKGPGGANQAIARAIRLRNRLTSAVVDMPATYAPFMKAGEFKVVPMSES